MHIRTMAIQINEKTWPVAVACLGGTFATRPYPEVEGSFLVINTPDPYPFYRPGSPRVYRASGPATPSTVSLGNGWFSEDDFRAMYKFDGRKNTDQFFDVVKVAEQPASTGGDDIGARLKALNQAYYGSERPGLEED